MSNQAAPLDWLICYTKYVSVWYEQFLYNELTDAQLNTIKELINAKYLINGIMGVYTDELERTVCLDNEEFYKLDELNHKKKGTIRVTL